MNQAVCSKLRTQHVIIDVVEYEGYRKVTHREEILYL